MEFSLIFVFIAALGILFRYNLGLTQACRVVGVSISDGDTNTGFQDAITPPRSTNITLLTWGALALTLGFAVFQFGWWVGGIAFVVFLVVSVMAGATFIPGPESNHYLGRIYHSMINRYADFQKGGDNVRADAMKSLITRIEAHYGHRLAELGT